ncbi:MAG: hypothetical protein LAT55_04970 [Opitutales bacterium]|nr:hypothetical protein [Opitutales bacterium]
MISQTLRRFACIAFCLTTFSLFAEDENAARKYYEDAAFAQAADILQEILASENPEKSSERWRELTFLLADARWRALAGTTQRDKSIFAPYTRDLRSLTSIHEPDPWAARAHHSLAEYSIQVESHRGRLTQTARNHFRDAFNAWSQQDDTPENRREFRDMVIHTIHPDSPLLAEDSARNSFWSRPAFEAEQLALARTLAETREEEFIIDLFLLMQRTSDYFRRHRGEAEKHKEFLQGYARLQKETSPEDPWFGLLVYNHGDFLQKYGNWYAKTSSAYPDFAAALEVFNLVAEEPEFEGRLLFFQRIQRARERLLEQTVRVSVPDTIRPETIIPLSLRTRNVDELKFSVYRINGPETFADPENWFFRGVRQIVPRGENSPVYADQEPVDTWSLSVEPTQAHDPTELTDRRAPLPHGAYWIQLSGRADGEEVAHGGAFFAVTDAAIVEQKSNEGNLVYVAHMETGAPLSGSVMNFYRQQTRRQGERHYEIMVGEKEDLDEDGIAHLKRSSGVELLWAETPKGPVILFDGRNSRRDNRPPPHRPYLTTDRPLYRPGDTVHLRYVERTPGQEGWDNARAGEEVSVRVMDPRRNLVKALTFTLDDYGVGVAEFVLPEDVPLGLFEARFPGYSRQNEEWRSGAASKSLFRVEEFRTPEFQVKVQPPRENGKPKVFSFGDEVEVKVAVSYYAGGAIPEAGVEYRITRRPFVWHRQASTPYPWLKTGPPNRPKPVDPSLAHEGTTTTDENGMARISFTTTHGPTLRRDWNRSGLPHGWEYLVEVTATDASRRTAEGSGALRVTREPFQWHLETPGEVYRPGAEVVLDIEAFDALNRPFPTDGTIEVARQVEAEQIRRDSISGETKVVDRGWRWSLLEESSFTTDEQGVARYRFRPTEPGLYRLRTVSPDGKITKEHTILVATRETHRLAVEVGRLQIYSESHSFRRGETGRLVIVSPYEQDNFVLLTTFGKDLLDHQLLRLKGNVRVVDIPLGDESVPNLHLRALMLRDRILQKAEIEWEIPPVEEFLQISFDDLPENFRPGEETEIGFTVKDHQGQPVSGNFALGVSDRAIQAIQPRLEKDIRAFFHDFRHPQPGGVHLPSYGSSDYSAIPKQLEIHYGTDLDGWESFWREKESGKRIQIPETADESEVLELLQQWRIDDFRIEGMTLRNAFTAIRQREDFREAFPNVGISVTDHTGGRDLLHLQVREMTIFQLLDLLTQKQGLHYSFTITQRQGFSYLRISIRSSREDSRIVKMHSPAPADPFAPSVEPDRLRMEPIREIHLPSVDSEGRGGESIRQHRSGFAGETDDTPTEPFGGEDLGAEALVRSDFRSTAHWSPGILTGEDGRGKVTLTFPENLTQWEIIARGITRNTEVGQEVTHITTSIPVAMRVQTPRFLVEGDYAILSGVAQNLTAGELEAGMDLRTENLVPEREGFERHSLPPGAQVRIDRGFHTESPLDEVKVTGELRSAAGSDAMEATFPVIEYGILQYHGDSLITQAGKEITESVLAFDLPPQKYPDRASLEIRTSASLASTALDALPYLANFPYGCTEQTLSRFLPSLLVQSTLADLDLDPGLVANRIFGGIEQTYRDDHLPEREHTLEQLDEMVAQGLRRLLDLQKGNGSWGWWRHSRPNAWMTAYAAMGLALAEQNGLSVPRSALNRSSDWLQSEMINYRNRPDLLAWMLYAVALNEHASWDDRSSANAAYLWENRGLLRSYGRSLLTLVFHHREQENEVYADRAKSLLGTLENGLREVREGSALLDGEPGEVWGVHWGEEGPTLRWNRNGVESTAWALRAFLAVEPDHPRADQAMQWLVRQRRGAQWSNTRDSALALMALNDYLQVSGELDADLEVEVMVNGEVRDSIRLEGEEALGVHTLEIPGDQLLFGENEVTFRTRGEGRLYASMGVEYFSREVPIEAKGNEVFVEREYRVKRRVQRLDGSFRREWMELEENELIEAGDRVEVRLLLEVPVDLEYLVFEDQKAAGLEPEQQRSGERTYAVAQRADGSFGDDRTFAHMEIRDKHTAFFIDRLPNGLHEIRYNLRAETPGRFTALPVLGHAMYVPEVRANSSSFRLGITDRR